MKTLFIFSLILLLTVHKCPQDDAHYPPADSGAQSIYMEKNLVIDSIVKEWNLFRNESKKQIANANKEIREAMDRLHESNTRNKLLLEAEIIKAESIMEQLCEKYDRGERFDDIILNENEVIKMNHYRAEYKKKEERLKKVLLSFNSEYYKK